MEAHSPLAAMEAQSPFGWHFRIICVYLREFIKIVIHVNHNDTEVIYQPDKPDCMAVSELCQIGTNSIVQAD